VSNVDHVSRLAAVSPISFRAWFSSVSCDPLEKRKRLSIKDIRQPFPDFRTPLRGNVVFYSISAFPPYGGPAFWKRAPLGAAHAPQGGAQ
jgi:hypothetical protein